VKQSASSTLCGLLLGAALALVPAGTLASEADPASQPAAPPAWVGEFVRDLRSSLATPIATYGVHAHSYHNKVYATSYSRGHDENGGRRKFNNQTVGVYLMNQGGWGSGFYRNSLHRNTFYAGRFVNIWGPLDLALGVATGYNRGVVPMIVPTLHLGPARLWVQPAIGGPNNTTMVHLSFEYSPS
jgi:hypothetical protein